MARIQVLVQLDDNLVRDLDALATRLGTSRSALLRRGAHAVVLAESNAADDAALVAAYHGKPQDAALVASAARLAARTAPDW